MNEAKVELIGKYVKERRNQVGNFDVKVQTSALLFNFFKSKGYDFYFAPKIKTSTTSTSHFKTPDFQASKQERKDIIGEIKQSLPNPQGIDYEKKIAHDLNQIKAYNDKLGGISTPHDVFLSASGLCNEAIADLANRIKGDDYLKDKIIILKYFWKTGNSHNRLTVNKVYGSFSDKDIEKEFEFKDYELGDGDLKELQGYYKIIYTEEEYNGTPIEYIMMIIWHNIIPELIKSADFDRTIERIKKGENTLEFSIDEIMDILDNMYTLKNAKDQTSCQFNRKMILDAMKAFEKISKAQRLDSPDDNPRYRISHNKLIAQKSDFLDSLIRELNKEDFESRANLEYQKSLNQSLFPENHLDNQSPPI